MKRESQVFFRFWSCKQSLNLEDKTQPFLLLSCLFFQLKIGVKLHDVNNGISRRFVACQESCSVQFIKTHRKNLGQRTEEMMLNMSLKAVKQTLITSMHHLNPQQTSMVNKSVNFRPFSKNYKLWFSADCVLLGLKCKKTATTVNYFGLLII